MRKQLKRPELFTPLVREGAIEPLSIDFSFLQIQSGFRLGCVHFESAYSSCTLRRKYGQSDWIFVLPKADDGPFLESALSLRPGATHTVFHVRSLTWTWQGHGNKWQEDQEARNSHRSLHDFKLCNSAFRKPAWRHATDLKRLGGYFANLRNQETKPLSCSWPTLSTAVRVAWCCLYFSMLRELWKHRKKLRGFKLYCRYLGQVWRKELIEFSFPFAWNLDDLRWIPTHLTEPSIPTTCFQCAECILDFALTLYWVWRCGTRKVCEPQSRGHCWSILPDMSSDSLQPRYGACVHRCSQYLFRFSTCNMEAVFVDPSCIRI